MKPLFLCLCIVAACFSGCKEEKDSQAKELYALANRHTQARELSQAIEILQNIRINYEGSEYAARAEEEIMTLQELVDLLLANQQRSIHTKFSRIHMALENYKARFLNYPLTPKDLEKLPRLVVPEWDDVWGHQIHYAPTYSSPTIARHAPDGYALASFGEDGLPGGEGSNKDHFFKNGAVVTQVTD